MKVTVWTSGQAKCIFVGKIKSIPRVGDFMVVREGFGCVTVQRVTYDFVADEIEIKVDERDPDNEYGPCLLYPR